MDILASIEKISVLVKADTTLPLGMKRQYASENLSAPLEIRIYSGEDASFILHEDEGNNYNYKERAYSNIRFDWNDRKRILMIEGRQGEYPGIQANRTLHITSPSVEKTVVYQGKRVRT